MERPHIEQKNDRTEHAPEQAPHGEAVAFVQRHRDFFEHVARGRVDIAPAPEDLNTFAFDLERDTIYVNSRFYKDRGLSDEKTAFATLHEIEHFLEKKQLLAEPGGERAFVRYLERLERSKAYAHMDNCVADIRENRAVVQKTSNEFGALEERMYKEDLFAQTDFTGRPRHIQLAEAILREARVPAERVTVSPEVREKLDELAALRASDGTPFLDILTNPDVPMSTRLALQDEYIWPVVEELLEQDMEEQEQRKDGGEKSGKGGDGDGAEQDGGEGSGEDEHGDEEGGAKLGKSPEGPEKTVDPNEVFKEAYEEAARRVPNAVPVEKEREAFEQWQESHGESPLERADADYADKIGVDKRALQNYRRIVAAIEAMRNPETGESVLEDLRRLIRRIIAERLKPLLAPRYPVEEGEELVDPAELVAQVKAGNLEPKVWESHEIKEKKGKKFGEVEITLVCDRSSSMSGAKLREQQRAAVLMMEALKEFAELADEERVNMSAPLEVRSEVYTFSSSTEDSTPLKEMSKELGEKERIEVAAALSSTGGTTTDFVPLEAILKSLSEEAAQKIKEGEVKKVVIVFTDGESDNPARVKEALESLREKGVVAVGVGVTKEGRPALETYAPNARLAETAERLPIVLADLLKEHLSALND